MSLDKFTQTQLISTKRLRELSRIQPGRAEGRALLEWTAIAVLIYTQETLLPFFTYPLTALLIASRQHAFLALVHEATHQRISNSRRWNDLVGELLAWPLFLLMRGYRRHHLQHHVRDALNTQQDPDYERKLRRHPQNWTFPMSARALAGLLLRDVFLLHLKEFAEEARDAKNMTRQDRGLILTRFFFHLVLAAIITYTGGWRIWLLYWLFPLLTFLKALLRIRSIFDHFALPPVAAGLIQARTVQAPVWERLLFTPLNLSIHGPHHLFPSVPYYRLRELNQELQKQPNYQRLHPVGRSYWQTLQREVLTS